VHCKSNALDKTILKIFCKLIECDAEQKTRGAFMAFATLRAWELKKLMYGVKLLDL
jgi:hypothetical protein